MARARNVAWWDANVEATDETEHRRAATELEWSNLLADRGLFDRLAVTNGDGLVGRRLELLRNLMLPHQVPESLRARIIELEAAVEARFSRHRRRRPRRRLDDNEIKRILRESDDSAERREAAKASKTVGAGVADDVRGLARLRNEGGPGARPSPGSRSRSQNDELDEQKLLQTLAACDRATAEPFGRWKGELDARLADRFGCASPNSARGTTRTPFFRSLLRKVANLDPLFEGGTWSRSHVRPSSGSGSTWPGFSTAATCTRARASVQHAFCIDVDRSGDVRVLANVVGNHSWTETMLHGLGHGVYDLGYGGSLPWLLRDTHLVTTEATALLFGALGGDREWLERVRGIDAGEAESLERELRAAKVAAAPRLPRAGCSS